MWIAKSPVFAGLLRTFLRVGCLLEAWARGDARPIHVKFSMGLSEHRFADVALEPV
jgi:hypothetical protein